MDCNEREKKTNMYFKCVDNEKENSHWHLRLHDCTMYTSTFPLCRRVYCIKCTINCLMALSFYSILCITSIQSTQIVIENVAVIDRNIVIHWMNREKIFGFNTPSKYVCQRRNSEQKKTDISGKWKSSTHQMCYMHRKWIKMRNCNEKLSLKTIEIIVKFRFAFEFVLTSCSKPSIDYI